MTYEITFNANTATYACHASGCSASRNQIGPFATVDEARRYADQDESEKAGEQVKANWRVCKCCKG